jgi:hypothetical protein
MEFDNNSFDTVLDKGTLDALMSSEVRMDILFYIFSIYFLKKIS